MGLSLAAHRGSSGWHGPACSLIYLRLAAHCSGAYTGHLAIQRAGSKGSICMGDFSSWDYEWLTWLMARPVMDARGCRALLGRLSKRSAQTCRLNAGCSGPLSGSPG